MTEEKQKTKGYLQRDRTESEEYAGVQTVIGISHESLVEVNLSSEMLLLIHGTADDNVHLRNMIRYTHALTQANKKFEMALYPDSNHSIYYGRNTRYPCSRRLQSSSRRT